MTEKTNTPPHQDLAQIIGVARVFPKADPDKTACLILAEAVHLTICSALQDDGSNTKTEENNTTAIYRCGASKNINCRQGTSVDHQGWNHMYADKIDNGIETSGFFLEHGVAPVLVIKAVEGIGPVGSETDAPKTDRNQEKNLCGSHNSTDGKGKKDHDGLYAPIGIVHRGIAEDQAKDKGSYSCGNVSHQKPQPKGKGEKPEYPYAQDAGNDVYTTNNQKASPTGGF